MAALDKLIKLADKFEIKLKKYADEIKMDAQKNTTELFFGENSKQLAFNSTVQTPESEVYKTLLNYAKTGKSCSFDLKASADPGKGAKWLLTVNPTSLSNQIATALNNEFKKIVGVSMQDKQKAADVEVKKGAGSGTLDIASMNIDV